MNEDTPALPNDDDCRAGTQSWPHAPPHRLATAGVYFVTSRAMNEKHLLHTPERRGWMQTTLLKLAKEFGWTLEAWAVLSNHFHIVAHSPDGDASSLPSFLRKLHSLATKECNRLDNTPGRTRLWHNYRETHLDLPHGYMARLNYVHQNAVHHRLVSKASEWPWCSAWQGDHGRPPFEVDQGPLPRLSTWLEILNDC